MREEGSQLVVGCTENPLNDEFGIADFDSALLFLQRRSTSGTSIGNEDLFQTCLQKF